MSLYFYSQAHLIFCLEHPLNTAVRQARGDPTVATWRKSLNVRTPMGNRRAPAAAAIKPTAPLKEDDPEKARLRRSQQ